MVAAVVVEATADTTLKAMEAARKAPECIRAQVTARPAANQAIRLRTAKLTLLQMLQPHLLPPHCNQSCWERRRPIDAYHSSA
jgi:hypothetical protein